MFKTIGKDLVKAFNTGVSISFRLLSSAVCSLHLRWQPVRQAATA